VATLIERVRDVLEKDQAEDEVLVLGRLDAAAELVGGLEEGRAVRAVDRLPIRRAVSLSRLWSHEEDCNATDPVSRIGPTRL